MFLSFGRRVFLPLSPVVLLFLSQPTQDLTHGCPRASERRQSPSSPAVEERYRRVSQTWAVAAVVPWKQYQQRLTGKESLLSLLTVAVKLWSPEVFSS